MTTQKKTVLVTFDMLQDVATVLTGAGRIVSIDHEGTITYEIEREGDDVVSLALRLSQVLEEGRAIATGFQIASPSPRDRVTRS